MNSVSRLGMGASSDRLRRLIEERLAPGADRAAIDRRIHDLFEETWSVMFTDLSGFSRNVARFGIVHFLQTIHEAERILFPVIEAHDGIVLKVEGDSFLVIFRRASSALSAARAMQSSLEDYNSGRPQEEWVLLCVGLGHGPVLRIGDEDVFGAEVNAAAKLGEDVARSGEILATDSFVEAVGQPLELEPLEKAPPGARRAWRVLGA